MQKDQPVDPGWSAKPAILVDAPGVEKAGDFPAFR
jgi:hypothetical protein